MEVGRIAFLLSRKLAGNSSHHHLAAALPPLSSVGGVGVEVIHGLAQEVGGGWSSGRSGLEEMKRPVTRPGRSRRSWAPAAASFLVPFEGQARCR